MLAEHKHNDLVILLVALLHVATFVSTVSCTNGWDVSYFQGSISSSTFSCLKNNGYVFGIIEATVGSQGTLNPYCAGNVKNAHAGGIPNVDVYIFPNISYNPTTMTSNIVTALKNAGALSKNMIWFDIESPSYWSSSASSNINWLQSAVNEANSLYKGCGLSTCVGIYSSASQWNPIMGGSTQFSGHQLWYAHYDNNPSFSDFQPFGGWTKPAIKQYAGTTSICGTQIDKDYY